MTARCTRLPHYIVRDAGKNVVYYVCERPAHLEWAKEQLIAAGHRPLVRPTADGKYFTTGCWAPKEVK